MAEKNDLCMNFNYFQKVFDKNEVVLKQIYKNYFNNIRISQGFPSFVIKSKWETFFVKQIMR